MTFRRAPFVLATLLLNVAPVVPAWAEGGYAPERYGASTYTSRTNTYPAQRSAASDTYLETRISDLENQLRAVYGKLEQAEWQNKRLQTQLDKVQGDLEMRLQTLEQRPVRSRVEDADADNDLTSRPPRPREARPSDEADPINRQTSSDEDTGGKSVTGRLGSLRLSGDRVIGADDDEIKPLLPKTPPAYGLTAQEQYDRAFSLLRNSEYEEAETAFKAFLKKNPKDKLADNAKYWLGETHYVRKQYDAAAVTFADAYQSAPKGPKAPDSLMKLGMSLAGLKKTEDACTTLGEVINRYPNASAAVLKRTQQELARLKCPA